VSAWPASLLSVLAVCLVSLGGVATLSWNPARLRRGAPALVSFAVGTLLGDAFIHLLPETFAAEQRPLGPSLLVLAGMLVFFVLEKLLRHHHGSLHDHQCHAIGAVRPELAAVNVIGDAAHNFIDGVLIGASYLVSPALGLATTVAVLCHEIPQELGDFGVLVHSGLGVRKAVLVNLASASAAVLGTVVALLSGAVARDAVTSVLVPMAAGGFVYIASADLIPELQHDRSWTALATQAGLISAGIAVMGLLTLLE
jgi:zinc and cadmium transporter